MAGSSASEDEEITGINVTPLVDVMLVLLIIFMVTATYIVNQSIDVNLPEAETGATKEESKALAFVIDKTANVFVDGKAIEFAQIPELIKERRSRSPKLQVAIAADEVVPHGVVVKLIDIVRQGGVTDFSIGVKAADVAPK